MGQQKDSKEPSFKFVQGNDSKIEYIKSFSSSELTGNIFKKTKLKVGNRMVVSIVNDVGSKDIERGSKLFLTLKK
jgi:hypothetical protein